MTRPVAGPPPTSPPPNASAGPSPPTAWTPATSCTTSWPGKTSTRKGDPQHIHFRANPQRKRRGGRSVARPAIRFGGIACSAVLLLGGIACSAVLLLGGIACSAVLLQLPTVSLTLRVRQSCGHTRHFNVYRDVWGAALARRGPYAV